jgi:glycosyltransferase involved in cell wall biosynthesis
MSLDVAYVSDQRFSCIEGRWYTIASFRLDYVCRELDVRSWTFWGRLDDGGDPSRLFPIVAPPALAGRLFFEGPRRQRAGPFGYAASALQAAAGLKRLVRRSDVVWLRQPMVYSMLAHRYCRPSQVVVSQQIGDAEESLVLTYPRYGFLRHLFARASRRINARADVAAFVSRDLARRYGGGRTDLLVANESQLSDDLILPAPPEKPEGPLSVVFVGRLSPEKCVDDLLRAIALVPETSLTIVGDGPRRAELEAASRRLGLDGRVTWCGYVPWGPELFRILRGCSVLTLPSATEGLGLVIAEAMSQALPVVATRVGGIPELVEDGVSGLLVDVHRPDQLANAFRVLRARPELRRRMAEAALETARRNTLERQTKPLLERIARSWQAKRATRDGGAAALTGG